MDTLLSTVLYHGEIQLADFYRDIDKGIIHFFHSGYPFSHTFQCADKLVFNLSPRYYYTLPIVDVLNYYLVKKCQKNLSSMALTAVHEAISNALLWGLLKVKRPENIFEFNHVIEESLEKSEREKKTFCLAVQNSPQISIYIVNPHDVEFDFESFQSVPSPYMRGSEIMRLFSDVCYDARTHCLELTFGDFENVYQAVAQS